MLVNVSQAQHVAPGIICLHVAIMLVTAIIRGFAVRMMAVL